MLRPGRRARPGRPGLAVAAPLVLSLLAAGWAIRVLAGEATVAVAEARLADQAAGVPFPPAAPLRSGAPPRALLADALLLTRLAQAMAPADRSPLLGRALVELRTARRARAWWGDATAFTAFALTMRDGPDATSARQALAQSYADAPYLRHAAAWRVDYGVSQWPALGGATQARIIDEAVWLARSDPAALGAMLPTIRGTPAYSPFMVRWVSSRRGDADFARR